MNPFNFADLSDIAADNAELAGRVANGSQDKIDAVIDILAKAAAAGAGALGIAQIRVAAIRLGVELPAEATIRKYLNEAEKQGSVSKPTRQTYVFVEVDTPDEEVSADDAVMTADTAPAADPVSGDEIADELAGL